MWPDVVVIDAAAAGAAGWLSWLGGTLVRLQLSKEMDRSARGNLFKSKTAIKCCYNIQVPNWDLSTTMIEGLI